VSRRQLRYAPENVAAQAFDVMLLRELALRCSFKPGELARYFGVSQRQLERLFKAHLSSTPDKWLRQARLHHAREQLRSTPLVKAVAYDLGFNHPAQFTRDFKALFGVTPSHFVEHPRGLAEPSRSNLPREGGYLRVMGPATQHAGDPTSGSQDGTLETFEQPDEFVGTLVASVER
jgi:AraC-like DNA-binding protein